MQQINTAGEAVRLLSHQLSQRADAMKAMSAGLKQLLDRFHMAA